MKTGDFFEELTKKRKDSEGLKNCIKETVEGLIENDTDINKPGMLLGRIQSGKTRAFIGVIALAFDNDYDMAIILTKGTKALAKQTYIRLEKDFWEFIQDDKVKIFDIMHVPENLPKYVLRQKLIMVVKKQKDNLKRIVKALADTYPDLSNKKLLIIDDEADYASIGFTKNKEKDELELKKIAGQIDILRTKVNTSDFLQVTATPYSLYLQPDEIEIKEYIFKPIRPAFTVLLPIYPGYVGGDHYFPKEDEESLANHIYEEVPLDEILALKKEDRRSFKLEEALLSPRIRVMRKAILNFITGACIRRTQLKENKEKDKKYSFIIHTEQSRNSHSWQQNIVNKIKELLVEAAFNDPSKLKSLIQESYNDLSVSLDMIKNKPTAFEDVFLEVVNSLKEDYLIITKVNSENEVEKLLDEFGQLKLLTPLNIFIGGQILDRGITIDNLIGFYYGRRPNRYQQDTVLQHSRMYGNREIPDLAVTRFYTAVTIYEAMKRINEIDNALRETFEKKAQNAEVVFIHKDVTNRVIPCSPNKILLSTTTTLTPHKRVLPIGFQTDYKSKIYKTVDKIDKIIDDLLKNETNQDKPFLMDIELAKMIISEISATLIFEKGYEWDVRAFKASMEYLSRCTTDKTISGKIWCLVRKERNISRLRENRFSNVPDSQDIVEMAREYAQDIPTLTLLRQEGKEKFGWRNAPFWWPVMVVPKNIIPVIYSSEIANR